MGKWICKECGEEILVGVSVMDNYDFTVGENGKPDELYSYLFDSIDDHIKKEPYNFDMNYKCSECGTESENIEDIAEWVEE